MGILNFRKNGENDEDHDYNMTADNDYGVGGKHVGDDSVGNQKPN